MLYGNRSRAFLIITEICINAIKAGFAHKHPLCWLWQSMEEQKLLSEIQTFSLQITEHYLQEFTDIDYYSGIFGTLNYQKWGNYFSVVVKEFYLSKNDQSAYDRQVAAKKYYLAAIKKLSIETRQNYEAQKKGKKNERVRKNGQSKRTNISIIESTITCRV